jgi:hypothetical protein
MRTIVAIVICLQVTLGTVWGIREPRSWHQTDIDAGRVTANISTASDQLVVSALYPNPFVTASSLRGLTKEAESIASAPCLMVSTAFAAQRILQPAIQARALRSR